MANPALYRKAIGIMITMALLMGLRQFGLTPAEFSQMFGVSIGDIQSVFVEGLVTVAMPTFIAWLLPNDPDADILDYWKVGLVGLVGILAIIGLVVIL